MVVKMSMQVATEGAAPGAVERPPLRTAQAARYLKEKHGIGSGKAGFLHKEAFAGTGPLFYKTSLRRCLYFPKDLDSWAKVKLGDPRVASERMPAKRAAA
jgi:hypothetical protein